MTMFNQSQFQISLRGQARPTRARAWWGTALAASLLFVGCSSSDDGSGGQGATTEQGGGGGAGGDGTGGKAGGAGTSPQAGAAGSQPQAGQGGNGGADDTSVKDACTAYGKAFCQTLQSCALRVANQYPSPSACADIFRDECLANFAAGTGWTVAQQQKCTATYSTTSCGLLFNIDPSCKLPPGPKGSGDPCFRSTECGAGMTCLTPAGSTTSCGVCRPDAKLGEPCGETAVCADGLNCNNVCYEPAKEGEGCYSDKFCAYPQVCGETGAPCHNPSQLGAACGPSVNDCDQFNGVSCHPVSKTCESVLFAFSVGDPCGFDSSSGYSTVCGGGLICSGNNIKNSLCKEQGKQGQPCEINPQTGSDPCGPGLYCIGKCVTVLEATCL